MAGADTEPKRRTRGRPPAIRIEDVVDAAVQMGPEEITIRGVADRLGVTRAAIYHYVDDVEHLRRLVARAVMVEMAYDDSSAVSWQEWMHGWAHAMRRWRLANATSGPGLFLTAEVLVSESMLDAIARGYDVLVAEGFPDEEAGRAMQFVVGLVWINTQDEILASTSTDGIHPQTAALRELELPTSWSESSAAQEIDPFNDPDRRFEYDLQLAIDGLSARLARFVADG